LKALAWTFWWLPEAVVVVLVVVVVVVLVDTELLPELLAGVLLRSLNHPLLLALRTP
jgi:hypothetical protein